MAKKGRRPGSPDTRGEILQAARREFATRGYDGATIRGIAASAGVDPALVMHYFGSKEELFVSTLRLPVNPAQVLRTILEETEPAQFGERLVTTLLGIWDTTADRSPFLAALRSATGAGPAATVVRQFIERSMIAALADGLPGPEGALRGALIGSQIGGVLLVRYVLRLEPLASADPERLAQIYGPTIQRYAHGELPPTRR